VSAVVACVLALRDQFLPHAGEGWNCGVPQNGRKHGMELPTRENGQVTQNFEVTEDSKQMETMVQKVSKSPAVSGEILFTCSKLWELFHYTCFPWIKNIDEIIILGYKTCSVMS
jgi:hypothetical protein